MLQLDCDITNITCPSDKQSIPVNFQMNAVAQWHDKKSKPVPAGHIGYLDALRGYAISGVFIAHFFHCFSINLPNYLKFFGHGVTLFYVLSAFCLMLSLHRHGTSPDWRTYCIRRFFRIAPAFYAAVAIWSLYHIWNKHTLNPASIFTTLVFVNGFYPDHIHSAIPHGWSVAVETSFYLLLPLLFLKLRNLRHSLAAVFFVTPLTVSASWYLPAIAKTTPHAGSESTLSEYTVYWLPAQLPVFLIGISTYFVVYGHCPLSKKLRNLSTQSTSLALGMPFIIAILSGYLPTRIAHIFIACGFASLIACLASHPGNALANRFMIRVGLISFSAYLFHQLSIEIAKSFFPTAKGVQIFPIFGFTALLCLLFASFGYYILEKPGISLGSATIRHSKNREPKD